MLRSQNRQPLGSSAKLAPRFSRTAARCEPLGAMPAHLMDESAKAMCYKYRHPPAGQKPKSYEDIVCQRAKHKKQKQKTAKETKNGEKLRGHRPARGLQGPQEPPDEAGRLEGRPRLQQEEEGRRTTQGLEEDHGEGEQGHHDHLPQEAAAWAWRRRSGGARGPAEEDQEKDRQADPAQAPGGEGVHPEEEGAEGRPPAEVQDEALEVRPEAPREDPQAVELDPAGRGRRQGLHQTHIFLPFNSPLRVLPQKNVGAEDFTYYPKALQARFKRYRSSWTYMTDAERQKKTFARPKRWFPPKEWKKTRKVKALASWLAGWLASWQAS